MSHFTRIILPALLLTSCSQPTKPQPRQTAAAAPAAASAAAPQPKVDLSDGVHVTASGLKYEVLQRGSGSVSPTPTDSVTVHYHGTLLDGSVFDSSLARGQPATFAVNGVIRGWTEGLQFMKVGDKFRFVIPPYLAYGVNSPSPQIPPMSTLVFEVTLLGINGNTN